MAAHVTGAAAGPRQRRRIHVVPVLVVVFCASYFVIPLIAMARFSFQSIPMVRLGWSNLFDRWSLRPAFRAFHDPTFMPALIYSVKLAVGAIFLTLALLLPTALWVHLRIPKAAPLVEVLSVLPYVVPPIALVVGVAGAFRAHAPWFLNSQLCLIPFYAVLAMPFTYRALDAGIRAIDLRTLVDASRSLGAGWGTTLWRVLVPNLKSAIIGSSFLTATVVLGEFTIASLLLKQTLPAFSVNFYNKEPQGGIAFGLLSIIATTLLLVLFTVFTRRPGHDKTKRAPVGLTVGDAPVL
jgi:putative spermidine/putrescine transport system permease protein